MEYVLMDIKNFLKKLENGQMEIEAGQWELHKALVSVGKTVSELLHLKEDVADMKRNNMHQMGIIKDLQFKLDKINSGSEEDQPLTVSESSVEYEGVFKRPCDGQGFKKRKCRIRSEEIIEITSQMSEDKSESELGDSVSITQRQPDAQTTDFKDNENEKTSDEESSRNDYKRESYVIPTQNKPNCHFSTHTSNDILQRYLKDSARYLENKVSKSSNGSYHSSKFKVQERAYSDVDYRPFWDEYSSRAPREANQENKSSHSKENTVGDDKPEKSLPKKFLCPNCPKKFLSKIDLLMHKRKHQSMNGMLRCNTCGKAFGSKHRLKDHKTTHKLSIGFKGFKCCYCSKICCTPEKLTEHLRKCRTVMKPQFK